MMKRMMQRMMPMMSGTIEKMDFDEKEKMMNSMMPHMLANMSFEEKMQMMSSMMPLMMEDIKMDQMDKMMDAMMPMMLKMMEQKGIDMFQMMEMMCPKCLSVATAKASEEAKNELKSKMFDVFAEL